MYMYKQQQRSTKVTIIQWLSLHSYLFSSLDKTTMVRKINFFIFITKMSGICLALSCNSLESIKTLDHCQEHKLLPWPIAGLSSNMHKELGNLPNMPRSNGRYKFNQPTTMTIILVSALVKNTSVFCEERCRSH